MQHLGRPIEECGILQPSHRQEEPKHLSIIQLDIPKYICVDVCVLPLASP